MYQTNLTDRGLRRTLLLGAASVAAISVSVPALAQDQGTVETVVVTGSRIPTTNLTTTSPVTELSSEDIKSRGTTRIEDLVNQLPQAFAAQNSTVSNGASGTATVDLRDLGADRTLVLIDGQRMPFGSPIDPAADLNEIPAQMVDRVEVLTGGASATYGSDAIAGVVNFIMKKDFEGLQLDFQYGGFQHNNDYHHNGDNLRNTIAERGATNPAQFKLPDDSVFDGESKTLNAIMGISSADGKGNITAYFSYRNTQPILESQRDFSACALSSRLNKANKDGAGNASPGTLANTQFACGGSNTSFPGYFYALQGPNAGSPLTLDQQTGAPVAFDPTKNQYNYGPLNFYQRPDERYSLGAFGHYKVNSHAEVYTQLMFTSYHSNAQIAPSGDFFNTSTINCGNPLLSSAQSSAFGCTPVDVAANNNVGLYIARRDVEGGPRRDDFLYQSFRAVGGVRGEITNGWSYDVSGQYARVQLSRVFQNDLSVTRLKRALDVVDVGGVPTCQSVVDGTDPNCVPWNIFQPTGGVTKDALKYLIIPEVQNGSTTLQDVLGVVNGDLGTLGIVSPFAKSPVQVALGFEYRQNTLDTTPDVSFQTADGAGSGGATPPVHGTTNVTEGFAEVKIPVIEDMPFAKLASIDAAYRYSSYNTGIVTNTWKVSGDWSPVDDFRLRASYERAVRAPNVIELFFPQGLNLFDIAVDPCGAGGDPNATLAKCQATGVPAANYRSAGLNNPAGQYNFLQGGNPNLQAEVGKTITLGAVFTPTFLPGFTASVDYFDIRVANLISPITASNVLIACYDNNNASQCAKIHRNATGSLWRNNNGFVSALNTNIGGLKTTGVDINMNYQVDIADAVNMVAADSGVNNAGSLTFNFVATILNELNVNNNGNGITGLTVFNCAGAYAGRCTSLEGTPSPRWRHQFRSTWLTPWDDIALSLTWRRIGEVHLDHDTALEKFGTITLDNWLEAQNYFDVSATIPLLSNTTLRVGANNVTDNDPPLTRRVGTTGNGNTYPQTYDAFGRFLFADITINL